MHWQTCSLTWMGPAWQQSGPGVSCLLAGWLALTVASTAMVRTSS
jgi:hypothetical protein